MKFNLKKYSQEDWYTSKVANDPNTSPDILKKILERGKNDWVSQYAAYNPNCPPDALKMVLERGNNDGVSYNAAQNPNCPPEALKMVLERGNDDWVSWNAAENSNCPPEALKMVLERGNNDVVSWNAARNPNCPPYVLKMILERGKDDLVSQYAASNLNCPPETLKMVLERGNNDVVSRCAAENPNCPPEALKMVLERGNNNLVSISSAENHNCPPETLKMVLERGNNNFVSQSAAYNPNCPPEALKMVLERGKDNDVSQNATENPNCPLLAKILWMRATGLIEVEDPKKHIIEYEETKEDTDLQKLRNLRDMASNKNWYKIAQYQDIEDVMFSVSDARDNILSEFFNKNRPKNSMMSWSVVPFPRLKKIWEDYAKLGFVRDEAGISQIANQMLSNLARLQASTDLSGHSQMDPEEIIKENGYKLTTKAKKEDFYWYFLETIYGTPISDYGLPKLWEIAKSLASSTSAEQKLVLIDQMLNVIHQRGDLASLFIEGGSSSLSQLSGVETKEEKSTEIEASNKEQYKIAKKENWYNEEISENPNTSPKLLKMILERGNNDLVSQHAANNPNCPPEALKIVLERGENDWVSQLAAENKNCPPDTLKMILERGKTDWVSRYAAHNPNCPPETLKMVLERGNDDWVSYYAARNPNCPPLAKILWMRATGKIGVEDPKKHIIEYEEVKEDTDLQKLRDLRDMASNKNWYKMAQSTNTNKNEEQLKKEIQKYKKLKDFQKDYEILYHGGSENIIGDKLSLGGRVPGEVTKENLGTGQDYGGIFFTPEKELAQTFSGHSPSGKGAVHKFLVRKNNIFDENNPNHAQQLKNFIGKKYIDVDGETVEFDYQMYDFMFPKLEDDKRHMDWATFDPHVLASMGFDGAKVIEHYDAYGKGKHLYSTVLFTGGQESPHWKIKEEDTLENLYQNQRGLNELV